MSTIYKTFEDTDTGELTDVTSMYLSSADGTFGVKRNDTGEVIVADGAAFTHISTGKYSYTFDDPAYDLVYTYSVEWTYGGETFHEELPFTGPETPADEGTAPSTNRPTYWDLVRITAQFMGVWPPSGNGLVLAREYVRAGIRQFYYPPEVDINGKLVAHHWRFMRPMDVITLQADVWKYDMPGDYASLVDGFAYPAATTTTQKLRIVPEGMIRRLRAQSDHSDKTSRYLALRLKSYTEALGHRYELLVYPTPSEELELTYQYEREPDRLDVYRTYAAGSIVGNSNRILHNADVDFGDAGVVAGDVVILSACAGPTPGIYIVDSIGDVEAVPAVEASPSASPSPTESSDAVSAYDYVVLTTSAGNKGSCTFEILPADLYPLGVDQYAECLMESCLAVAEARGDDVRTIHHEKFMQMLQAYVRRDRESGPRYLGVMYDPSGEQAYFDRRGVISYHGVETT